MKENSPEVCVRAVWLMFDFRTRHASQWEAIVIIVPGGSFQGVDADQQVLRRLIFGTSLNFGWLYLGVQRDAKPVACFKQVFCCTPCVYCGDCRCGSLVPRAEPAQSIDPVFQHEIGNPLKLPRVVADQRAGQ